MLRTGHQDGLFLISWLVHPKQRNPSWGLEYWSTPSLLRLLILNMMLPTSVEPLNLGDSGFSHSLREMLVAAAIFPEVLRSVCNVSVPGRGRCHTQHPCFLGGKEHLAWALTHEPPPPPKYTELIGSRLLTVTHVYTSPAPGTPLVNYFTPTIGWTIWIWYF